MSSRDPSSIAVKNGNYFGLEVPIADAEIVILQAPWDVTTSYQDGTRNGPQAVLDASYQLDLFTPFFKEGWKLKIATAAVPPNWLRDAEKFRALAKSYIQFLESGGDVEKSTDWSRTLEEINAASEKFHASLEIEVGRWLDAGKKVALIGGDHSVSWGTLRAHCRRKPISILHFDAHADLRLAYEGFPHSHASIMNHFYRHEGISKLVQVGIRDVSPQELAIIAENPNRIKTFFDWDLQSRQMNGESWSNVSQEIIGHLTDSVYISFDVDGLDPRFCPHTGTPVPGGLDLGQALFLLQAVVASGRTIVGVDLVEVAPDPVDSENQWDGNVGARLLFHLCALMRASAPGPHRG